jgi:diguanylate cyclase (GGDEF)-like protein
MFYDFSEYFKDNDLILNEFIQQYTTLIDDCDEVNDVIYAYKQIFDTFLKPFDDEKIIELSVNLAESEIKHDKPYTIVSNEIHSLQNILVKHILSLRSDMNILELLDVFNKVDNKIAQIYLMKYIENLLSINNKRINSLADLIDRNFIKYYEAHLIWLSNLAKYVKLNDISLKPEEDETKCEFGMWLDSDGKNIIRNNSKYKAIKHLHNNLHMYGNEIESYMKTSEYHIVITYLEKCELMSLSIGTELALIDNVIINNSIIKDKLTGAMNRHALDNVFASQYELALATKNSFVVAMCDLDFFKSINDNYGHICGDHVLKVFVETAKKHLRNSDMIIRYGGEEFVIILPALGIDKGFEVLERIRVEFSKLTIEYDAFKIKSTLSMGMVEINPEYEYKKSYLEKYLSVADKNLYCAKTSGRDQIIKDSF